MKKIKKNPYVKNVRNIKGIKSGATNNDNEIKSFIILILAIAVLIGAIYGITELLKKDKVAETEKEAVKINYDMTSVGSLLNRPYDEYYVMIYDSNNPESIIYSTLLGNYIGNNSSKDDFIKVYYCDLSNKLNEQYYNVGNDNKSNPNAKSIKELDLGDLTLIKVKKGKIVNYLEDYNKIEELLK